jgi:hypothetical protein
MIESLPPELAKLIAAEKVAPAVDQGLRTLIRAKLAASVAATPAAATAAGIGAGKIIAIVALVAGAGTIAVVKSQRTPTPRAPITAPLVAKIEPAPQPQSPPPVPTPPPPAPLSVPTPIPSPNVPSQAELLHDAWSALSHSDAEHALELATRDARVHGSGPLSEERDALRIIALAKLGRTTEATDANTRFVAQYPNSIHRDLIDNAIGAIP